MESLMDILFWSPQRTCLPETASVDKRWTSQVFGRCIDCSPGGRGITKQSFVQTPRHCFQCCQKKWLCFFGEIVMRSIFFQFYSCPGKSCGYQVSSSALFSVMLSKMLRYQLTFTRRVLYSCLLTSWRAMKCFTWMCRQGLWQGLSGMVVEFDQFSMLARRML